MASHSYNHWEVPTFHFNSPNQSEDWRTFYTLDLNYLDAPDIMHDQADNNHKGWKQFKVMFEGEDRLALQILMDDQTIMPEDMKKPSVSYTAITIDCSKLECACA